MYLNTVNRNLPKLSSRSCSNFEIEGKKQASYLLLGVSLICLQRAFVVLADVISSDASSARRSSIALDDISPECLEKYGRATFVLRIRQCMHAWILRFRLLPTMPPAVSGLRGFPASEST